MSDCCYKGHQGFEYFATTMFGCNSEARCRAYKAIVRPLLEYACVVWSSHTVKDVNLLEAVQRRAPRWSLGPNHMFLGLFLMMCATRCCIYLPCVPGVITYQFVLFRAFVIMVPFLFQTVVHTTLYAYT